jgi:hypothetical protein
MADGLFMTPEMARQAAMEKGMLSSAQMAQLPLLNQVAAMGGNAGTMIGSSLGGLLGGVSPLERENQVRMQEYEQKKAVEAETNAYNTWKREQEQEAAQRQQQAREVVAALPTNATPRQIRQAITPFVSPEKVLEGAQAMEQKQAAIDARTEQIKMQAEARSSQIQEQAAARIAAAEQAAATRLLIAQQTNATREQVAAMQGESNKQIAQMRADAIEQAAKVRAETAIQLASLKTAAAQKGAPKDVAEAEGAIVTTLAKLNQGSDIVDMLNDPENKGLMTRWNIAKQKGASYLNLENKDEALKIDNVESFLTDAVNTVLIAAKGVQTEGDAQRAAKQIIGLAAKGDNEGYVNAIKRLNNWANTITESKKAYMKRRGYQFQDNTNNEEDPLGLR